MTIDWIKAPAGAVDNKAFKAALARQGCLTKPAGSLGRLEEIAVQLCGLQGSERPSLERARIVVFAADHGIAAEGVSAFPQVVTREMVRNFAAGGAAISVLARSLDAVLEVVDVGVCHDPGELPGVVRQRVAAGSANFAQEAAMTEDELAAALAVGRDAVNRAIEGGAQIFIAGEMGIANTSAATALACVLLDKPVTELVGPGTGLKPAEVSHKAEVIERALALHLPHIDSPEEALRRMGGLEIAAIVGAYLTCAQRGLPVLVDGFITTAAALVASRIQPDAGRWWFYSHASAEPGHRLMVEALGAAPLIDLGMRLGEGSGAATALPLLRLACALHNEMATFEQAGVSEQGE